VNQVQDPAEVRLDALWHSHAGAVVRYARRRVLPGEVDEVVAETFLVAWRRLDEVPEYPLPWLIGVARGVSANVLRTARRRTALTDRLTATAGPERAMEIDDPDLAGPLTLALASLRPQDRELLMLLAWDGLSHDEAATALKISRGAVAVRLHRLRRRLKTQLDLPGPPDDAPQPTNPACTATPLMGLQR
jgi:RNA polymerase sigma-70 factor (ECF subfamily)